MNSDSQIAGLSPENNASATPENSGGKQKKTTRPPKRRWFKRLLLWCLGLVLAFMLLGIASVVVAWMWLSDDLPRIERLADYQPPAVTQVVARDGSLMAEYYDQRRYVIPVSELPPHVIHAFVAAEDGGFYQHPGVDLWGIARATINNFRAGRVVQGGSTITQQVAKTLLLTPERTFVRKIKEAILAWRIEQYLSKEEILYLYLNQIFLGHNAYGIEAGAQTYFGKNAKDLTIAESALLAGLVQAPSRYSPIRYPRRARTRQVYTIGRMAAENFITQEQARAALNTHLTVSIHKPRMVQADYYSESVRAWLEDQFGANMLLQGGLTVYTSCDPKLTEYAQRAVEEGILRITQRKGFKGPLRTLSEAELAEINEQPLSPMQLKPGRTLEAVVVEVVSPKELRLRLNGEQGTLSLQDLRQWRNGLGDVGKLLKPGDVVNVETVSYNTDNQSWELKFTGQPIVQAALVALEGDTGRVRAMIGGRSYQESQFNRATQARRQPGSSFKPYIYCAAIDRPEFPYTPSTILMDTPVEYPDVSQPGGKWRPKNFDNKFSGPITLRRSLELSRNVTTVKLLVDIGLDYTMAYLKRFGFESELSAGFSLALGSSGISLMEQTRGYSVFANQGRLMDTVMVERVLDRHGRIIYESHPISRQAISPATAFVMTHLLRGVILQGTGTAMNIPGYVLAGKTGTTNETRDAWFMGYSPQLICGVWVGRDDNQTLGGYEIGGRAAGPIWKMFMEQALAQTPAEMFEVPGSGVTLVRGAGVAGFEAYLNGTQPGGNIPTASTLMDETGGMGGGVEDFLENQMFMDM